LAICISTKTISSRHANSSLVTVDLCRGWNWVQRSKTFTISNSKISNSSATTRTHPSKHQSQF